MFQKERAAFVRLRFFQSDTRDPEMDWFDFEPLIGTAQFFPSY